MLQTPATIVENMAMIAIPSPEPQEVEAIAPKNNQAA